MKVGIVDYRMGNLASVSKAIEAAGGEPAVSDRPDVLGDAGLLVLPGVGNFAAGMANLKALGLDGFTLEWARADRPLLGICLGMQLFFEESDEGSVPGLGIVKGRVRRFGDSLKVPHMGWNILQAQPGSPVFGPFAGRRFYFVHSYYCVPQDAEVVAARTCYGLEFASAVQAGRIHGVQFHPEKSSDDGLALLRRMIREVA